MKGLHGINNTANIFGRSEHHWILIEFSLIIRIRNDINCYYNPKVTELLNPIAIPRKRFIYLDGLPKSMRKQYIINLNPNENPRQGSLKMGVLYNPFPQTAVGSVSTGPVRSQWVIEMEVKRHLRGGVSLDQARWLLKDFDVLTEEATNYALHGAKEGEILEVIVDSDELMVYQRKIAPEEKSELTV